MRIQLDRIRDEPLRWRETLEIEPAALDRSELLELSPVRCEGRVAPASPGYAFSARLAYEQVLACDRCLEPTRQEVATELELFVLAHRGAEAPGPGGPEDGGAELEDEDLTVVHVSGDELDTEPLLVEQLQLSIPMKPLCREDCAGLCPICGADRNESACSCHEEAFDPRWQALKDLKAPKA